MRNRDANNGLKKNMNEHIRKEKRAEVNSKLAITGSLNLHAMETPRGIINNYTWITGLN